jgi:peptidoglycan/LPS O-acetylase OafA/YrhL
MARNERVDVARGLLIVYIVAVVHAVYWLNPPLGAMKSLLLFEMPVIFLLSGYSFALSRKNGLRLDTAADHGKFMVQRIGRIVIPYVLYAVTCLVLIYWMGDRSAFGVETILAWLNPMVFKPASVGMLDAHLWFIAPFLCVTLCMPMLATLRLERLALPAGLALGAVVILVASDPVFGYLAQSVLFYLVWAALGYAAGMRASKGPLSHWTCLAIGLACAALVVWLANVAPGPLDIQRQKFPPNIIFYLFGLAWLALLYLLAVMIPDRLIHRLAAARWFRPFIDKGYSIYMWQGLGYTLAMLAGDKFKLPMLLVVALALTLSVVFGFCAAPLENIRIYSGKVKKVPA